MLRFNQCAPGRPNCLPFLVFQMYNFPIFLYNFLKIYVHFSWSNVQNQLERYILHMYNSWSRNAVHVQFLHKKRCTCAKFVQYPLIFSVHVHFWKLYISQCTEKMYNFGSQIRKQMYSFFYSDVQLDVQISTSKRGGTSGGQMRLLSGKSAKSRKIRPRRAIFALPGAHWLKKQRYFPVTS